MIPPVVPGQTEEQQNMVGWKNTFNMRQVTLMNLAASCTGAKNGSVPHLMSGGCVTSPAKSLDLLRRNLQNAINKDIDNVIKKYLERFFEPAINNIKMNLGKNSINEELVKSVCQQMLEDAKTMYKVSLPSASSRDSSPYTTYSDSDISGAVDARLEQMSPMTYKRKESDTDSDSCVTHHKRYIRKPIDTTSLKLPEKREGRKWDPDRITPNTLFIMGARANKVLGFGQTRGRLYVRHPNVFRYPSDAEDKEWLSSHNLMPPSGGKAYLMLIEDVQELALSDDYRHSPNLQLQELCGFQAPPFLISKVKEFIESVRTDKKEPTITDLYDCQRGQPLRPFGTPFDSSPAASDTFTLVETHRFTTTTSKQSAINIISIPDPNPSINNFITGHFNQSTLCSSSTLSQDLFNMDLGHNMGTTSSHNDSTLAIVEKVKRRRILDHLISTHGTVDSS